MDVHAFSFDLNWPVYKMHKNFPRKVSGKRNAEEKEMGQ